MPTKLQSYAWLPVIILAGTVFAQTQGPSAETRATGKDLVARFTKEFESLVKDDRHAAELRNAAKLLESTNESDRWTNASSAIQILRKHRSKAAIPLIMKYMIKHATLSIGHSVMSQYTETLSLLTGRKLQNPYRAQADRFTPVVQGVEKMVDQWWAEQAKSLVIDLNEMSDQQLAVVVDALLEKQRRSGEYVRDSWGNHDPTAYRLYHVLYYDIMSNSSSSRRTWRPEELSVRMVPILLEKAGYEKHPPDYPRRESKPLPFEMVHMLAWLRKNDRARTLHEIAEDDRQNSAVRLICILALRAADERLRTDLLISMLKPETLLERRLTIILALQHSRDTKKVLPVLLAQLEDENSEIRSAAIYALRSHATPAVLPKLKSMLDRLDPPQAVDNVMDVIGEMKTEQAKAVLVEFMREGLTSPTRSKYVPDALGAFATATDRRWYEAGAHSQAYYLEQAAIAVRWWDSEHSTSDQPKIAPTDLSPSLETIGKVRLVESGNRGIDATRHAVQALLVDIETFQLRLTYHGPRPTLYPSILLSVPALDERRRNDVKQARISKTEATLIVGHLAGNGFLFRGAAKGRKRPPRVESPHYELSVSNGKDVYVDFLPWAGRSYRWYEQPWPRTFDQISNISSVVMGDGARIVDLVARPLAELKSSIIDRSKQWKTSHSVADFDWLVTNAIPIGSPEYHVRELLGDPLGKEIPLAGGGSYWPYTNSDADFVPNERRGILFDAKGKMAGVRGK